MSETSPHFRMLHTMVRVKDLEASKRFYIDLLGMRLLRQQDFPDGKFTLAFVGYGPEEETAVIELTHNWDQEAPYELGAGYGHVALGVHDIYGVCEMLGKKGATLVRPPGPMKHGKTVIAFIEDPDGYKIELIDLATQFSSETD